jgi:hypothetical protein
MIVKKEIVDHKALLLEKDTEIAHLRRTCKHLREENRALKSKTLEKIMMARARELKNG